MINTETEFKQWPNKIVEYQNSCPINWQETSDA